MASGGKRRGAGRKPGSASKKTRAIADRAAEKGITPLEVMNQLMLEQWEVYQGLKAQVFSLELAQARSGAAMAAVEAAKAAAPFMHPRLKAGDPTVKLPGLEGSLTEQGMVVMVAIAAGRIAPDTGATLLQAIATLARITESDELEKRVKALEEKHATDRNQNPSA
jgi:hypothetical protein